MNMQSIFTSAPKQDSIKARQTLLIQKYSTNPGAAMVFDKAHTSSKYVDPNNPFESAVKIDKREQVFPVGVHKAVGGESANATPGDILCGALAACFDSTLRIIANRFDLKLRHLSVNVTGKVDVRGTLRTDRAVPVAFQAFDIVVDIKPKGFVPSKYIDKLITGAEQSCIVMQTLKPGCEITVRRK